VLRKSVVPLALVCALVLPVSGASAADETLSITPGTDPIAGIPSGLEFSYNTRGSQLFLQIVTRPVNSPQCQASPDADVAVAGSSGTTYITPAPLSVNGNEGGHIDFTWPSAGDWRICGWLYGQPAEAMASAPNVPVSVRAPKASLTIDLKQLGAKPGGADVMLHAAGSSELPSTLFAVALPDRQGQCPATYSSDSGEENFAPVLGKTLAAGPFDQTLQTRSLLPLRRWRVCAYLQDGDAADTAIAVASQFIDLKLKPTIKRKPKITFKGSTAKCDGGRWAGRPKPRLSVAWKLGSKKVGKGKSLKTKGAWKGKKLSCVVTARSSAGKKTVTSRAQRV
jgi:hypothetical protein